MAPKRAAARRSNLSELNRLRSQRNITASICGEALGVVESVAMASRGASSLVSGFSAQGCHQLSGISTSAGTSFLPSPRVAISGIDSSLGESPAGSGLSDPDVVPGVGTPCLDGRLRIAGIDSSSDDVAVDPVFPESVLVDSIFPGRVRLRGLDFSSAELSAVSERARPDGNAVSGQNRVRLPGVDSSSEELSAGHVCQAPEQARPERFVESINVQGRVRLPGIDCSSDEEGTVLDQSKHVNLVQRRVRLAGIDSSSDEDAARLRLPVEQRIIF